VRAADDDDSGGDRGVVDMARAQKAKERKRRKRAGKAVGAPGG